MNQQQGGERKPPQHERALIDAAERESAELSTAWSPPLPPADSVPGYRINREIGRGGMGVVYDALQLSTDRTVALKVMLAGPFASRSARGRFDREVNLAARLQHHHIVRLLESGESPSGQRYFAMDRVIGKPMAEYLTTSQPSVRDTIILFERLCHAVQHAHDHGVIHRDLKPANILIDDHGEPRILDFGLAKAVDAGHEDPSLTMTVSAPGQVLGTLAYLSPEQAAGCPELIDERTDVYALGVMLFKALTGAMPFDLTGHPSQVIQRILEVAPTPPSGLTKRVNRELQTIVLKALEKDREQRYASAVEMARDLRRYLQNLPILARPPHLLYRMRKAVRRHRIPIALTTTALALGAAGLAGGAWWNTRTETRRSTTDATAARSQVLRVLRDLQAGRARRCLGPAQALTERFPQLPDVHLTRSQVMFQAGRELGDESFCNDAIGLLQPRLGERTYGWAYTALLAEMYSAMQDPRSAQLTAQSEAVVPQCAEDWYMRSIATMDASKARLHVENALRRDPLHQLAWQRSAYLCLRRGDFDGALRAADRIVRLSAHPEEWTMFAGHTLAAQGRYHEAAGRYSRVLLRRPAALEAQRCRAHVRLCLRDYPGALADYDVSVRADGSAPWERYQRATVYWILNRLDHAAEDYRTFISQRGNSFYASARLFLVLDEQARRLADAGQTDAAAEMRRQATEALEGARGGAVSGSWLESIFLCLAGELKPEELVARAGTKHPERACEGYYYAAEVCLLDKNTSQALEWFRKCVDTGVALDCDSFPPDPMNEYHLARWRMDTLQRPGEQL
ncbi:MAG: protein kinase [bacterium]|nr:protein kinase [bacterium]